jgi:hypothetical protein
MTPEWDARQYLLEYTHRWPLAILAFLVGALLGLAGSYIFPTPYASETTLFVAYNSDALFRNPDDYKNWHMGELNALMVAPDIVQETHARLRQIDPYWDEVPTEELRGNLIITWRNTGTWRLVVESDTAHHASTALDTWVEVFLETYQNASNAAFELTMLSGQLEDLNIKQAEAKIRYAELIGVREGIQAWMELVSQSPEELPLDLNERWRLWSLVSRAAGYDPAWEVLLRSFPEPDAVLHEYNTWVEASMVSLGAGIETLETQIETFETLRVDINTQYSKALEESRGLSSSIHLEKGSDSPPDTKALRNTSLAVLVGGLIGVIVWFVVGLVRTSFKGKL